MAIVLRMMEKYQDLNFESLLKRYYIKFSYL